MEDTHVWLMDADGKNRRELTGAIDNRQGEPGWSNGGRSVLFTVQERGNVRLYRMPVAGGKPVRVVERTGQRRLLVGARQSDRIRVHHAWRSWRSSI